MCNWAVPSVILFVCLNQSVHASVCNKLARQRHHGFAIDFLVTLTCTDMNV